jgi:sec-independent protein translocase protein TatA
MGLFGNAFGWPHLIVILVIVLLLFGAPKLPGLAKSVAQSMNIFRNEIKTNKVETEKRDADTPVVYTEEPPAASPAPTVDRADPAGSQPKQ